MNISPRSRAALVTVCAAITLNVGFVSAIEIAEADAINGSRSRTVTRSTKSSSRSRSDGTGATGAGELTARQRTLEACAVASVRPQAADFDHPMADGAVTVDGAFAVLDGQPAWRASFDPLVNALHALLNGAARVPQLQVSKVLCSMAETMHEGLAVCDARGTLVYVNNSLCRMLGQRRERMIGSRAADFFPGMPDRFVQDAGEASFEVEWHDTSAGGDLFKVAVNYLTDANGEGVGCFAVVRDFSRRHRAEIALCRSESELRLLSAQLLAAHETERRRIARGLHDGIGQSLGGIKFCLESWVARLSDESPHNSTQKVRQLVGKVQGVIEEVTRVAMNLRPSVLDHLGVAPTIEWFCREFNAIYSPVQLVADVDVCEDELTIEVKTAIYRIVQESCNNAVKYAQARRVTVSLKQNCGQVELAVADDGIGFDPAQFVKVDPAGRGLGLASMRERVEFSAGRFRLESKPGQGTTIIATWPSQCPRIDMPARGRISA